VRLGGGMSVPVAVAVIVADGDDVTLPVGVTVGVAVADVVGVCVAVAAGVADVVGVCVTVVGVAVVVLNRVAVAVGGVAATVGVRVGVGLADSATVKPRGSSPAFPSGFTTVTSYTPAARLAGTVARSRQRCGTVVSAPRYSTLPSSVRPIYGLAPGWKK